MSRLHAARVVVVEAALADGMAAQVRREVTLLVDGATVAGLWFDGAGPDPSSLDAEAGVDSIEHGFALDADAAAALAAHEVTLVSTLAVLHSWQSFRTTSVVERFTASDSVARLGQRREQAEESVRLAHRAGVTIAAGSDFGGGSLRANQLAWEVEAMVAAGIEPHVALAAATWRGGDLLGDETAGRLNVGGPAHFSLVHGDPLTDPSALWRIWLTDPLADLERGSRATLLRTGMHGAARPAAGVRKIATGKCSRCRRGGRRDGVRPSLF